MSGFSILMLIFATLVLFAGIYIYTGHKNSLLLWKVYNLKSISKDYLKKIGKGTIFASMVIYIIAIFALIFNV